MPDREKVIREFEKWCDEMEDECPVICLHALALLKEQEAVVRCKDCKYHDEEDGKNFCDCGNRPDDWFCADGKKKYRFK